MIYFMYLAVKNVKALDDYILLLTFENNEVKRFDMKPFLNSSVYQQLKDVEMFNSVKPSFDTVEWNEDIDIDPEILYSESF